MHVKRDGLTPSMRHGRFLLVPLIVVAAIVAMAGCASPATFQPATFLDLARDPPADDPPFEGEVRVLENLPSSDQYTRVGIVKVEGVLLTKEAEMVAKIKEKAADKGADAVVMQSAMKVIKNSDGSTTRRLAAWAIRLNR